MRLPSAARKLAVSLTCLVALVGAPAGAMAQDEPEFEHDGRLEGYGETLAMEGGNRTLTWIGFALLAGISVLALFKDAKRSHLD
jgi:hypothetical protein